MRLRYGPRTLDGEPSGGNPERNGDDAGNVAKCLGERGMHPVRVGAKGDLSLRHDPAHELPHEWQSKQFQVVSEYGDERRFVIAGQGYRALEPVDVIKIDI